MPPEGRLLLVGASPEMRRRLRERGAAGGWELLAEERLSGGLSRLQEVGFTATFLSTDLEAVDLAVVERLISHPAVGALIVLGRTLTAEQAMEATRAGVSGVLRDPATEEEIDRVLSVLRGVGGARRLPTVEGPELVGHSPELLTVFEAVGRVAASSATVLITGESGTGKELVARALHGASRRAGGAFVAVNCAAIPEDLLESELFGHERGAFTGAVARKIGRFERASGGTLFLDEIGDMSLVLQAKILRALQEREIERLGGEEGLRVDVRVVCATNRDLEARVAEGEFREDLYYRVAVVRLRLPALRERPGDIRELALHYAARYARDHGRPVAYIAAAALERLERHSWPGNVRELGNVLERAVLVATGDTVREEDISIDSPRPRAAAGEVLPGYRPDLTLRELEALHLARVLASVEGRVGRAAEILGVHRNTITRKAAEYGISDGISAE